ncbi:MULTISPECIES: ABC transporter substrate-binding protein [unclassified Streptomyces]|uniref:ABC transporter substrate-binding protein n=1 Tax=unclassified Streptomyces TaxID=2593676 RepID=UPI00352F8ADC|nr:ABC transporter substrate-binding protein [Streptomyces sp. NBC_01241]WSU19786.1 ABC transporter substrate-binding protein [Streptomyces sp. NBC_01108]
MPEKTGRTVGKVAACGALLLALTACSGGAPAARDIDLGPGPAAAGTVKKGALDGVTLTFASYGGIYQDGQETAAVKPFATESGAKMLSDGPTDYTKLKAQVDSGNVTWDVVDTDAIWAERQCGKLLMPLDTSIVDTSKLPKDMVGKCSVPAMTYGMVLMYDTSKFGANPPKDWADFFDTAKFPGKRAIPGVASDAAPGPLEAALIADGVAPDKLFPLDVDRGLKKLTDVRSSLVFWDTGARSQQLLESGEVSMAMVWTGRAYSAVKNGAKFAPQWNQFMPVSDSLAVPKNARNPKASMALINYYLGAGQQARLTELTSYSPINSEAEPKIDAAASAYLTSTPERQAKALKLDNAWWAQNQEQIIQKWSDWLAR